MVAPNRQINESSGNCQDSAGDTWPKLTGIELRSADPSATAARLRLAYGATPVVNKRSIVAVSLGKVLFKVAKIACNEVTLPVEQVSALQLHIKDAASRHAALLAVGGKEVHPPISNEGPAHASRIRIVPNLELELLDAELITESADMVLDEAGSDRAVIRAVDHLAFCVAHGALDTICKRLMVGLDMQEVFRETTRVGTQAMNSRVLKAGGLIIVMIEPAVAEGYDQINAFLVANRGPGIQHIALLTDDIAATLSRARGAGTAFRSPPAAYYHQLAGRLTPGRYTPDLLSEMGILVDEDEHGQLYQIFATPTLETSPFFFELIERDAALTFGSGNIKALYEAVAAGC